MLRHALQKELNIQQDSQYAFSADWTPLPISTKNNSWPRLSARIQGGDKILKYSHHRDTIDTTVDKIEREAIVTP